MDSQLTPEQIRANRARTLQRVRDEQYPHASKREREANRTWWTSIARTWSVRQDPEHARWCLDMADAWTTGPTEPRQLNLFDALADLA